VALDRRFLYLLEPMLAKSLFYVLHNSAGLSHLKSKKNQFEMYKSVVLQFFHGINFSGVWFLRGLFLNS
jgi:hypothetical protein